LANGYLQRRNARVALAQLKREIIFGMVVSSIMLGTGTWRYYIVVGVNDALWSIVAALGALGLLVTLILPWLWKSPEAGLTAIVRRVGGALFAVLLALVYGLLIFPVGWMLRRIKGADPVYSWESEMPLGMEGWHPKEVVFELNAGSHKKPNLLRRFVNVLQFFARRRHYVFLPTLVILLALGMVLFFVKASALAPLIYTLF